MEIKQGDKVRIANNAPEEYRYGFNYRLRFNDDVSSDSEVVNLSDDGFMAAIVPLCVNNKDLWFQIPTKYLVKVDAEAKEPKFKKGDKVVLRRFNGATVKAGSIGEVWGMSPVLKHCYDVVFDGGGLTLEENYLEPYTEPTAPIIKAGDRVRNIESGVIGVVDKIVYENIAWVNGVDGKRYHWKSDGLELIEPTEQTEVEKPNVGSIKIPVELDLTDSYWAAYAADLAKEVVLKVANKYNDPEQAAEYAVKVAKAVVEGLKRE
jgi:uncharacterized protein (UPF0216 family)